MANNVQGLVESKRKNDAGYWSVKLGGEYFGAVKYEPKFNEGDEVAFDYTENGKYKNMTFGTVKVLESASSANAAANASAPATGGNNKVDWDGKDKRITFLACRKDALEVLKVAVSQDALTLPTKKADKLEAIILLVDELANRLYSGVYDEPFKEAEQE